MGVTNDLCFLWATGLVAGMGFILLIHAIRFRKQVDGWVWAVVAFVTISGCVQGWTTFRDLQRSYDRQIRIDIDLHKAK